MNWWKVFQEKKEKILSDDENKENDIELSEDEKELDEVDREIRLLQVTTTINFIRFKVYEYPNDTLYDFHCAG